MNRLNLSILSAIFIVVCGFMPSQSIAEILSSEVPNTINEKELQLKKPASPTNLRMEPGRTIQKSGALNFAMPNKLPDANANDFYETQLQVSGGTKPFSYGKVSPSLPPGLSIREPLNKYRF